MDESDPDFDIRELSNSLSKEFPWPIGVELRRLLSGNMEKIDRGRLDQILKTIERTMQYLSFVMINQLLEEKRKAELQIPETFTNDFPKRFCTLTLGNYSWIIRSISKIFQKNSIRPFMLEMESVLSDSFLKSLDFWVPERNEIGHYLINLTDEEIEVRCQEYLEKLENILSQLAFMIVYPLVTITEVQVVKPKSKPGHFNHNMLMLNSSSSTFLGKMEDFNKFTDTHAVLLVRNIKNAPDEFLNLSPLIVDTHFEKMESREKLTKLKKDVYLYNRWEAHNRKLHYAGTETVEKVDMTLVSFYDQLVNQFEDILKTFSPVNENAR